MRSEKIYLDRDSPVKICLLILFFLTPLVFFAWATTFNITKETFAELVILTTAVFWLIRLTETGSYHLLKSRLTLPILVFLISLLISLPWTSDYYTSFLDLARWLGYILIYFILISCLRKKKWMSAILSACLLSAFLAASYSIFQYYGFELAIWRKLGGRARLFSTFGNPNYLAGYLSSCLPISFVLWIFLTNRLQRGLLTLLIFVLYTSLLMTFSRGAWIALFLSTLLVIVALFIYRGKNLFRENRTRILGLILALLTVTAIYSTSNPLNPEERNVLHRAMSTTHFEQSSIQQRLLIWLSTFELIKERPITGWGVGSFGLQYPSAQGRVLSCEKNKRYIPLANKSINAHNDYLHLWAETGIIGLTSFIWILIVFYRSCFSFLRKKSEFLLIGFMGSVTAILCHGLVSFPFHVVQNGLIFWLMISFTTLSAERGLLRQPENQGGQALERNKQGFVLLRRALRIGLILAAICLGVLRIRIFIADTHLKMAEMLMGVRAYSMAVKELEKAIKINPHNGLALANLGQVYDYLGRYDGAIEVLEEAKKNWVYPGLYNNLGYAYVNLKDFEKAEEFFRRNIHLFPNASRPYFNMGHLTLSQGERNIAPGKVEIARKKLDEAFTWYEQGRVFNPQFPLPSRLAKAYYHLNIDGERGGKISSIREVSLDPPFFSSFPILDLLPFVTRPDKPISFELFFYLPEAINSRVDGAIEIRGENEHLFKKFTLEGKDLLFNGCRPLAYPLGREGFSLLSGENIFSNRCYLLTIQQEKKIPPGEYMAIARIRYGRGKLAMARRKFSISPLR